MSVQTHRHEAVGARPRMLIDRWVPGANFVNEHRIDVGAPPSAVWGVVCEAPASIRPTGAAGAVAKLLLRGAALARGDWWRRASFNWAWSTDRGVGEELGDLIGTPAAGLRVVEVEEGREVVLAGAHAYAAYATNFFLEALPRGRTRVHNVSRAKFMSTIAARAYFQGVRLFHDPLVAGALRKLQRLAESRPAIEASLR